MASLEKIARAFDISLFQLLTFLDDKKIIDTDVRTFDKTIEVTKQALEQAKGVDIVFISRSN